jgi:hypothetical protein
MSDFAQLVERRSDSSRKRVEARSHVRVLHVRRCARRRPLLESSEATTRRCGRNQIEGGPNAAAPLSESLVEGLRCTERWNTKYAAIAA